MFLDAKNDFNLDLKKCLIIGDSYVDIEAGFKLEMDTMLVLTGNGNTAARNLAENDAPTYIVQDLNQGARELCL